MGMVKVAHANGNSVFVFSWPANGAGKVTLTQRQDNITVKTWVLSKEHARNTWNNFFRAGFKRCPWQT